jgi:hypothetical protein
MVEIFRPQEHTSSAEYQLPSIQEISTYAKDLLNAEGKYVAEQVPDNFIDKILFFLSDVTRKKCYDSSKNGELILLMGAEFRQHGVMVPPRIRISQDEYPGAEEKIDIFMSRVIPESSSNYLLYLEIPPDDENKPKVRLINRRGKIEYSFDEFISRPNNSFNIWLLNESLKIAHGYHNRNSGRSIYR